jgi:hypothetical protein
MARLHMDMLATAINGREVRKALTNLPRTTSVIYDNTMERVDGQIEPHRRLAHLTFFWIICACRPLSFKELQHALAISSDLEMTEMDPSALVDKKILTDVCAGLVVVDTTTGVRLVRKHSSYNTAECHAYS